MSSKKSLGRQPLPLSDTLQDLAILRAADIDLSSVLQASVENDASAHDGIAATPSQNAEMEDSVKQSYDYVQEARAALRVLHQGKAEMEGGRIDAVREELEEVVAGLEEGDA